MIRRPPRATRTDTLFPDPTLFRSFACVRSKGYFGKADGRDGNVAGRTLLHSLGQWGLAFGHRIVGLLRIDQILRHESCLRARLATVLGRSSNSRSSLGMGFSHGAFPAKPLISSFRPDVSAGSKVYLLCSSRTTISAPSLRPSAFGSRNASELPDLNTFARYSLSITASVYTQCIY